MHEDGEHPVAFFSKKFGKAERNWSSTELEAIGIIRALDHFRPYIHGQDFKLRTDNAACMWSWLKRQVKGKLARWAARLAEWEGYMEVEHRAGKKHGNADGFTRADHGEPDEESDTETLMGIGVPLKRSTRTARALSMLPVTSNCCVHGTWCKSRKEEKNKSTLNMRLVSVQRAAAAQSRWDADIESMHAQLYNTATAKAKRGAVISVKDLIKILELAQRDDDLVKKLELNRRGMATDDDLLPDSVTCLFRKKSKLWCKRKRGAGDAYWLTYVPHKARIHVIHYFHDSNTITGHLGVDRTMLTIKQRFWWSGMHKDIRKYVTSCPWCQKHKGGATSTPGAHPKLVEAPNRLLSMDLCGPFQGPGGAPKMILTMQCTYTGYIRIIVLNKSDGQGVKNAFIRHWELLFGGPEAVIVDRGSQFIGDPMKSYLKRKAIKTLPTTARHPQSNNVERAHRWIGETLRIYVDKYGEFWESYMKPLEFRHNITANAVSGLCPFELFYGRKPRLAIDILSESNNDVEIIRDTASTVSGIEARRRRMPHDERLEKRRERQLRDHPGGADVIWKVGDWVFLRNRKLGKLCPRWSGPYPIVEIITSRVVLVRRKKWGKLRNDKISVENLKRFHKRDPIHSLDGMHYTPPPGLQIAQSTIEGAGWGVISTRAWPKGTKLGQYTGELIDQTELDQRYPGDTLATFVVETEMDGEKMFIDASDPRLSNWARFMNNHGTDEEPNVEVVDDRGQIFVRTLRRIVPGEELVWDYGWEWEDFPRKSSTNNFVRRHEENSILLDDENIAARPYVVVRNDQVMRALPPTEHTSEVPPFHIPLDDDSGEETQSEEDTPPITENQTIRIPSMVDDDTKEGKRPTKASANRKDDTEGSSRRSAMGRQIDFEQSSINAPSTVDVDANDEGPTEDLTTRAIEGKSNTTTRNTLAEEAAMKRKLVKQLRHKRAARRSLNKTKEPRRREASQEREPHMAYRIRRHTTKPKPTKPIPTKPKPTSHQHGKGARTDSKSTQSEMGRHITASRKVCSSRNAKQKCKDKRMNMHQVDDLAESPFPIDSMVIYTATEAECSAQKEEWKMGQVEEFNPEGNGTLKILCFATYQASKKSVGTRKYMPSWVDPLDGRTLHASRAKSSYQGRYDYVAPEDVITGRFDLDRGRIPQKAVRAISAWKRSKRK
jgi:hypothetical protein